MPIFTREPEEITLHSLDDLVAELRQMARKHGTQVALAKHLDVTPAYLSEILRGTKAISEQFAAKLGYRRETWYRKDETR